MSWKEIIKQPRNPGPRPPQRPGSGGGTRERVKDPKLVFREKVKTKTVGPKSTARDVTIVAPTTETATDTDTEYEDECECQNVMCKRKAEYQCEMCDVSFCVFHKRQAESKAQGKGKHIHGFRAWDCETNVFYDSIDELRDEAGEP